jgi:hypothetical protein
MDNDCAFLPLPTAISDDPIPVSLPSKSKTETRGEAQIVQIAETNEHFATNALPKQILVLKRALAVFRSMFPDTLKEQSGEVEWETFVLSMGDAGFDSRNSGGSIVIFEEKSGLGRINFHRPHLSPKIDPIILQGMGRRMNKRFNWSRETFAVATKVNRAGGMPGNEQG